MAKAHQNPRPPESGRKAHTTLIATALSRGHGIPRHRPDGARTAMTGPAGAFLRAGRRSGRTAYCCVSPLPSLSPPDVILMIASVAFGSWGCRAVMFSSVHCAT